MQSLIFILSRFVLCVSLFGLPSLPSKQSSTAPRVVVLDTQSNTHPRWKPFFWRLYSDYQALEQPSTGSIQTNRTIWGGVGRLQAKLDKLPKKYTNRCFYPSRRVISSIIATEKAKWPQDMRSKKGQAGKIQKQLENIFPTAFWAKVKILVLMESDKNSTTDQYTDSLGVLILVLMESDKNSLFGRTTALRRAS